MSPALRVGHRVKATDGREYEFFVDEYQRRWWRCVEDPSRLEPYNPIEAPPLRPERPPRLDPWIEALSDYSD